MVTVEQRIPISRLELRGSRVSAYCKETDTGNRRSPRDYVIEKGVPCVDEI
jgi:hypothetical protein